MTVQTIDFNAADPYPFIQATKEILGEDNCYWMTAYGTMQESEAFRNLCRAYGMKSDEFNDVGKDLDSYREHPKWKDIIEDSKNFIGVIDSVSPHPCANILLSQSVSEEIGVIKVGDEYCALIDSTTSDSWNYLKNDYLTVSVWRIIADAFKSINQPIPDVRTLSKLVGDDEKVWRLYELGLTATLNQTGTDSGTPQVIQYSPKNIRELSGWVSAIRPAFSSMKHYFLNRKGFSYGIPEFDEILKESDNYILYQENIMSALVYAGFSEDETYGLLKAIAKKQEGIIEPIHDRFIKGFVDKTGSEENALRVWKILEDSVGYGFNASHAYSVALDSVYGAYLKANYPLAYYAVVLNIYRSNTVQTAKIMRELKYFNISVESIKYGKSRGEYSVDEATNSIYKGIGSIKFMNVSVAEELFELAKENKYDSFLDLLVGIVENTKLNKTHISTLIKLDFFSDFGCKIKLFEIYEEFRGKYSKNHIEKTKLKRLEILREFQSEVMDSEKRKPNLIEQIVFEKDVLGYAITKYPEVGDWVFLVLDVNEKYTPRATLYRLSDGEEVSYKISKNNFYYEDMKLLHKGDIIQILDVEVKNAWKMENNKWIKNEEKTEDWINLCKIIKRNN